MTRARRATLATMLLVGPVTAWGVISAPDVKAEQTECMGAPATIVGDKDAVVARGIREHSREEQERSEHKR